MNEKTLQLYEKRKERAAATLKNGKADRIPIVAWRSDYLVYYYGYDMNQMDSYDKMIDIYKRASDEFDFEVCDIMDPIGLTYPIRGKILDGTMYSLSEDGNCVQINPDLIEIMRPEEYDDFIKDPAKLLLDTVLPRRLNIFTDKYTKEEKLAKLKELDMLNAKGGEFRQKCFDETGLLGSAHIFYTMPVDQLFDFIRNFTGITKDIRRCPDKVAEAADVLADFIITDIEKSTVLDYSTATAALHLAPYIKPKDFEKVYWPSFKKIIEHSFELGHVSKLLFEKSWKHLFDYLDELPANSICGYFEKDDGFENVCKRLGDRMIIAGGIDTNLLARGTKEQCVSDIKRIIDECCQDGGVFLAADMPMVYGVDGKPENFKAVIETIREYGNY